MAEMSEEGCPKCGHAEADVGEIAMTGTGMSKLFDVQNNQFKVVSCQHCGYSELYRDATRAGEDVVDIFLG